MPDPHPACSTHVAVCDALPAACTVYAQYAYCRGRNLKMSGETVKAGRRVPHLGIGKALVVTCKDRCNHTTLEGHRCHGIVRSPTHHFCGQYLRAQAWKMLPPWGGQTGPGARCAPSMQLRLQK